MIERSDVVARLARLATIGAHANGIDRPLASPPDHAARGHFADWARAAGFTLAQDRVGNLFARRAGTHDRAPILVGSHLDTVPAGGAYDGAYGVVGALCAIEVLQARGEVTQHPLEAVAWAGEEGGRFPLGCLGSSVFAGLRSVTDALALRDEQGCTLESALASADCGLLAEVPMREKYAAAAYLELHVEQGPVLEREGVSLGVVTAIAGQRRYRIAVEGTSGHAGTVPMSLRSDALAASAQIVLAIEAAARAAPHAVATVGRMEVAPGAPNVIARRVLLTLDARSGDDVQIDAIEAAMQDVFARVQRERGVRVEFETLESRPPTPMDGRMRAAVHRAIASLSESAIDLPSGAGHDARCLAGIVPAAMIFVPSIGGKSHVRDESTNDADLRLGVEALARSVVEVDRMLCGK